MLARVFHDWERRLASVSKDRVVRQFEWGLDWIGADGHAAPDAAFGAWADAAMADSDRFFDAPPLVESGREGDMVLFPSAIQTSHAENNTVYARYFPAQEQKGGPRRAVVVLPQWNADPGGHVALCQWIARTGISALRLSLPYHDRRRPPELTRADYIVSANVGRTVQGCRQAVVDARRAIDWLEQQGYERIGILGTSLGSCLAMLTAAHDRRVRVAALNHISPYFADVVWRGLSTAHVKAGLDGAISLDLLRRCWMPISPQPFIRRLSGKRVLLVYARYDLTFPVDLSRQLVGEFGREGINPEVFVLPCGHYSTGIAPFSWMDGYVLVRFLRKNL